MKKFIATLIVTVLTLFSSCKKPSTPPPPAHKPILVLVIGGLGGNQMVDVYNALNTKCSNAQVILVGGGAKDAYKENLVAVVDTYPHDKLVYTGQSMGGQAILEATKKRPARYIALFDPVAYDPLWGDLDAPTKAESEEYIWYFRTKWEIFLPVRSARLRGGVPTPIHQGHNAMPHDTKLIQDLIDKVNSL